MPIAAANYGSQLLDSPGGEMLIDSARALPYDYAMSAPRLCRVAEIGGSYG